LEGPHRDREPGERGCRGWELSCALGGFRTCAVAERKGGESGVVVVS
jgi:hypothetical protein